MNHPSRVVFDKKVILTCITYETFRCSYLKTNGPLIAHVNAWGISYTTELKPLKIHAVKLVQRVLE